MNHERRTLHYSFKQIQLTYIQITVFYLTKSTDLIITDESRSDEVSRGKAEVTHSIFEC